MDGREADLVLRACAEGDPLVNGNSLPGND